MNFFLQLSVLTVMSIGTLSSAINPNTFTTQNSRVRSRLNTSHLTTVEKQIHPLSLSVHNTFFPSSLQFNFDSTSSFTNESRPSPVTDKASRELENEGMNTYTIIAIAVAVGVTLGILVLGLLIAFRCQVIKRKRIMERIMMKLNDIEEGEEGEEEQQKKNVISTIRRQQNSINVTNKTKINALGKEDENGINIDESRNRRKASFPRMPLPNIVHLSKSEQSVENSSLGDGTAGKKSSSKIFQKKNRSSDPHPLEGKSICGQAESVTSFVSSLGSGTVGAGGRQESGADGFSLNAAIREENSEDETDDEESIIAYKRKERMATSWSEFIGTKWEAMARPSKSHQNTDINADAPSVGEPSTDSIERVHDYQENSPLPQKCGSDSYDKGKQVIPNSNYQDNDDLSTLPSLTDSVSSPSSLKTPPSPVRRPSNPYRFEDEDSIVGGRDRKDSSGELSEDWESIFAPATGAMMSSVYSESAHKSAFDSFKEKNDDKTNTQVSKTSMSTYSSKLPQSLPPNSTYTSDTTASFESEFHTGNRRSLLTPHYSQFSSPVQSQRKNKNTNILSPISSSSSNSSPIFFHSGPEDEEEDHDNFEVRLLEKKVINSSTSVDISEVHVVSP